MGEVAKTVLELSGNDAVYGVIPRALEPREVSSRTRTHIHDTLTHMHTHTAALWGCGWGGGAHAQYITAQAMHRAGILAYSRAKAKQEHATKALPNSNSYACSLAGR